jgi:type II secretory pathway component GspD/PulD (secretin)
MIRATPSCEEGGGVVVNLKIERTRLLPKSKADGAAEVEPQQTVTLTANSTVRIPAGQSVLVSGSRSVANEQATETADPGFGSGGKRQVKR